MYDLARQQVRQGLPNGLFQGVPSLMKDLLVYCAGVPTRSSNRFFRDFVSDHDSDIVQRYRQAGAWSWARPTRRNWGWLPYTEPVLVACLGDEATRFRLAAQLEKARPWFDRRPLVGHG